MGKVEARVFGVASFHSTLIAASILSNANDSALQIPSILQLREFQKKLETGNESSVIIVVPNPQSRQPADSADRVGGGWTRRICWIFSRTLDKRCVDVTCYGLSSALKICQASGRNEFTVVEFARIQSLPEFL